MPARLNKQINVSSDVFIRNLIFHTEIRIIGQSSVVANTARETEDVCVDARPPNAVRVYQAIGVGLRTAKG